MGRLKIQGKRGRLWLIIFAVLALSVFVSGCSGTSSAKEQTAQKQTEEQKKGKKDPAKEKEKKSTQKEEIPQGLLPGQTEGEGGDGNNEAETEENGATYADDSSAGSKIEGGNQTVSGNGGDVSGGTDSSGNSSQKHMLSIQFSVDSSNADGSVSYGSAMTLPEGATVYDALAATGLSYTGYGYIEEIGGLWEKDFGPKSGWKYYVNGSSPMLSCVDYVLKDGDSVQWVYVLNP